MASIKAPLLSLGASGQLGKTLVATRWKGVKVLREYVIPTNPRTADQITVRDLFASLVYSWRNFFTSTEGRAAWNRWAIATGRPMSGFNGFIQQAQIIAQTDPTASYAKAAVATTGDKVTWEVINLDDGTAGTEAGLFEIWAGDSPTSLLYRSSVAIAGTVVVSAALGTTGEVKYVKLRKDSADRSGVSKVTLIA